MRTTTVEAPTDGCRATDRPILRPDDARPTPTEAAWEQVRERLHAQGLRWTPQRRTLVEVLQPDRRPRRPAPSSSSAAGRSDPTTTPSTVYRTLDVLEDLGYVSHHHGIDGREEFHVLPTEEHGHLHCRTCGASWEIHAGEADAIAGDARTPDAGSASTARTSRSPGRCATCAAAEREVDAAV